MTRITLFVSLAACLMAACLSAEESANRTPGPSDRPSDSLRNMLVINSRRHPACFRDTVPPGFPNGAQLPVDATARQTFRIHIGPKPEAGEVWAVAGLAQRDGVDEARFEASLNNRVLGAAENMAELQRLGGGTVRGVRFLCPLDSVKDGTNELSIRQIASSKAQQIVWVEMRLQPK